MAYSGFSTTKYIKLASGLVTAAPLTMACWARTPTINTDQKIVCVLNDAATAGNNLFQVALDTTNHVTASVRTVATGSLAQTSTTISANTWFHGCAVFSSSTSRSAYLNGAGKVTATGSFVPAGINSVVIGVVDQATNVQPFLGDIAEVGIWNVALDDAEVASLAAGFSPLLVRPQSLVAYLPLIRELVDLKGSAFTLVGVPVPSNDHYRVFNAS